MRILSIAVASVAGLAVGTAATAADVPVGTASQATIIVNEPLTIGSFEAAGDVDWYRVELMGDGSYAFAGAPASADDESVLTLHDPAGRRLLSVASSGEYSQGFWFRAPQAGTYFLSMALRRAGKLPAGYSLRAATDLPPNASVRTVLEEGEPYGNRFDFATDEDWVRLALRQDRGYRITVESDYAPEVVLRDPTGTAIAAWDSSEPVDVTAGSTGEHFLALRNIAEVTGTYTITIEPR